MSSRASRSGRSQGPGGPKRPKGPGKGRRTLLDLCRERFVGLESERLYAAILCGDVYVNGVRERNPKQIIQINAKITLESVEAPVGVNQVDGEPPKHGHYVSRGGEKLEAALAEFDLDPTGCCVLDAGASTGGFTDCLLRHGAECVHAVDVGYNQLAYELRNDSRVRVQERVNIKSVTHLVPPPDFAVADLSFRSLCGVAGHLLSLTTRGVLVALLKPQFERRSHVTQRVQNQSNGNIIPASGDFDGVVTDLNEILRIAVGTVAALESEQAYTCGVCLSPIKGRSGNQELFLLLESTPATRLPSVEAHLRTLLRL
ncbi:MAG: TlyA family RNA methyltransferase [Spirochaeta sp.]|nr:TlyA family RNA methyltransferase [Spirochaeta sp.]